MRVGTKTRLIIALALVFLAGLATGVFGGAWHARHAFAGRHGERMGDRMREHLRRELKLTPEQLQQVDPIVQTMAKQLQEIRAESGRRVSETIEQSHEQIAAHLTSDQQAELKRLQQRHQRMLRHHGMMPPPADQP
jgi:Spy/CpxP family protein refolding chaperone